MFIPRLLPRDTIDVAACDDVLILLENLGLPFIDDEGMAIFARGLARNRVLKTFYLTDHAITEKGRATFSNVLCDTTGIVTPLFLSNHTLRGMRRLRIMQLRMDGIFLT